MRLRHGLFALLFTACATVSVPNEDLVRSEALLQRADERGAARGGEQAASHYAMAQRHHAEARRLMNVGQHAEARRALRKAQADAELAAALAEAEAEQSKTEKTLADLQAARGR